MTNPKRKPRRRNNESGNGKKFPLFRTHSRLYEMGGNPLAMKRNPGAVQEFLPPTTRMPQRNAPRQRGEALAGTAETHFPKYFQLYMIAQCFPTWDTCPIRRQFDSLEGISKKDLSRLLRSTVYSIGSTVTIDNQYSQLVRDVT
ncbi:hypothetical protein AVEN_270411-1 [Araneus ventricosus]|uniref:Uncharacterized protein n=1 Tax=Araneus ventricosus TaxID=182803 RepID=A0A4Y2T1A0_ARAVE|nr:hypothetical protein AVEN_270411-1 [Araneus ventricosus]